MSLLAVAAAAAATAQGGQTIEPRLLRFPDIHGNNVVFSFAGDLWLTTTEGGIARRLTSYPGPETRPKISPDGTMIAFTGTYDGAPNVYVMPIEGGEPRRLTYDVESDNVLDWTPDGKIAYATSAQTYTLGRQQRLFIVDPKGGLPKSTPIYEITEGSFFADGNTIAYTRFNSYAFNWRRYRGGSQGKVSIYDMANNKYSELPHQREQSYFPMVIGRTVYYISDKNQGTLNLYRYNLDNRNETQLTRYADADIRYPSTDGKTIVWERDGFLWAYDVAAGGAAKKLAPRVLSDSLSTRPRLHSLGNDISSISLSPSGTRVAVEARGELFSVPAKTGDTRNFTRSSGARERYPRWSPDGRNIAYVSDATGDYEVYIEPQLGGEATKLTDAKLSINNIEFSPDSKKIAVLTDTNDFYVLDVESKKLTKVFHANYGRGGWDWSPDSKWIAYTDAGANRMRVVHMYEVETGKSTPVTTDEFDHSDVSFDLNGKYLYIVSSRTFSPSYGQYEFSLKVEDSYRVYVAPLAKDTLNPLIAPNEEEQPPAEKPSTPPAGGDKPTAPAAKVDLGNWEERIVPLPMPAGNYGVVGANNGVYYFSGGSMSKFDLGSRESQLIASGALGQLSFNANRTKVAYYAGGALSVNDIRPGMNVTQNRVNTSAVEAVIDPRQEWRQIFWEGWRWYRDHFYDPNFRGQNWRAIGERYAQYLPDVNHRSDLNYVMGMMIGELGTGHSYVGGGDMGVNLRQIPTGHLGVDYEVSGNNLRFKKIYKGNSFSEQERAPLSEPGVDVKEGEYLLAINGIPVTASVNPDELLINSVGRYVTITVNSTPSIVGARTFRVRPIASEIQVRYRDFIEGNRRKAAEMSNGRIGYMHISNTATEGAIDFIRGFFSQTDKQAMIVDERWNGGGFIQPWFVDTLERRMRIGIQARNTNDFADSLAIEGPKAMLINGYAGSGGDLFPWMFRQSKLGPLIGKRTWGGLVGISGSAPLVDGGFLAAPEFSLYDRGTTTIIAENTGIDPDMDVDMRPDLVALGQDPQLDAAIKHLLEELRRNPPPPARKKFPDIDKAGRIGG